MPVIPTAPHANDNTALQNYIEKYQYDTGNNLIQMQHIAQQDSWTRKLVVSNISNRAVIATINGKDKPAPTSEEVNKYFDSHGNQIQTSQINPLVWDYRDNLQQVTTVKHADGTYDGEYYVYDGSGQRIRKVSEQYGQGGQVVSFKETLYLGSVEYRRTLQGKELATATVQEEYHSLRVNDDQQCVTTRDYWIVGNPPSGFSNPSYRYHLDDYLGSCTVEVDEQGQQISYEEYTPFGTSLLFIGTGSASQLKQYRYGGKERDSVTGFYYYGARYYAPWLGRWLSPDPAGTVDGLNLYAFVSDDPETFWDVGGMARGRKRSSNSGSTPRKRTKKTSPAAVTSAAAAAPVTPVAAAATPVAAVAAAATPVTPVAAAAAPPPPTQVDIKSSKFRVARLIQKRTGTTRNILTAKYKDSTNPNSKANYLVMLSTGLGNTKLTMPNNDATGKKKRGHTEGIMHAIMLDQKVEILDGSGGYKELKLENDHLQYISSTNEACSGDGSECCKTEVVPVLLKNASNAKFYYNNDYAAGSGTAGGFKTNTSEYFKNPNDDSEPDSENDAEFYGLEAIPDSAKDRSVAAPASLKAQPLKDFVDSKAGIHPFLTTNAPKTTWKPWDRRRYKGTKKKSGIAYPNASKSLYKHFS